jgi:hypothetical protein
MEWDDERGVSVVMVTSHLRARIALLLIAVVAPLSRLSADLANTLLWLAWRCGQGQYRINGGALRPLSREVIEPYLLCADGVNTEVWIPSA